MEQGNEFKHIVRMADTDLDGARQIGSALRKIKGVSFMFSNMVCTIAKIDKRKRAGDLSEQETKKMEEIINNPIKFGAPIWMLNRRKDFETGEDRHVIASDLAFIKDTDIKIMKKIKSYKGVRHIMDQPVRGQRTKSHFRKNKGKVHLGVKKNPTAKKGRT